MDADTRIAAIAAVQLGLVARGQALDAGLSAKQIRHRCRTGAWVEVRPGVYRIAGVPPSWQQTVLAACLAPTDAVASHSTAARLLGVTIPPAAEVGAIEVLTPLPTRVRLPGVVQHRSGVIPARDRRAVGPVPCTSAERLVVDLSGRLDATALLEVAADAERKKLLKPARLRTCVGALEKAPGRRPAVVKEVVDARLRRATDLGESPPEDWVHDVLVAAGFGEGVPQYWVRGPGWRYRLDYAFPPELVGLEYDSWQEHGAYRPFHDDRKRLRHLTAAGWAILPVTSETRPEALAAEVASLLAVRRA